MTNNRRSFLAGGLAFAAAGLSGFAFAQEPAKQEIGPEPIVYVCPMHPDVNSKLPGLCPRCNMKLVAAKSATASGDFYVCPMHPDVMSNQPGTCPKCNMKLVKSAPPETSDYIVRIKTTPAPPKRGASVQLQFTGLHPLPATQSKEFNTLPDMPSPLS